MAQGTPSKAVDLSKRALFRGQLSEMDATVIRPPWALAETAFLETCTACDKCLGVCEEGILKRGAGGYPEIDFQMGECTFCGDCAKVCEPGAIIAKNRDGAIPWNLEARIDSSCLSSNAVTCRVCGDRCDSRAIRFQLAVGGIANPIIDPSSCTGCGACVAPCPVDAVEVVQVQMEEQS